MSAIAYQAALELAQEDEALAAAMENGESVTLSMNEDGGVNVSAGSESVDFPPEVLAGDGESPSMPPPAPEAMP
jgi:hypothetical protein